MVDSKVIEAFDLMWGKFPEPVMLVHKTREILAVNEACRNAGGVAGSKCSEKGTPEQHKGCLANQALATQEAKYSKNKNGDKEVIGYWLPVTGYSDIYVHFGIGTVIDYNKSVNAC
jgi:hypothetical protein